MIRSDMYCYDCDHSFIAQFDLKLDGNHIVECPYYGHGHCRNVKKTVKQQEIGGIIETEITKSIQVAVFGKQIANLQ